MADVSEQLAPGYIAVKRLAYRTEVVPTDGGRKQRNSRWSAKLAQWDVTIPRCRRSSAAYTAVIALFDATLGSGLSFTFHDPVDCVDVECFILEDSLVITPLGNNLVEVEFSVEEKRA
jgi:uncharacterized protein (TIGR02217 family)